MAAEVLKYKVLANAARDEFSSLERDEERWAECCELARYVYLFIHMCMSISL
jgi:hypothetical protein